MWVQKLGCSELREAESRRLARMCEKHRLCHRTEGCRGGWDLVRGKGAVVGQLGQPQVPRFPCRPMVHLACLFISRQRQTWFSLWEPPGWPAFLTLLTGGQDRTVP